MKSLKAEEMRLQEQKETVQRGLKEMVAQVKLSVRNMTNSLFQASKDLFCQDSLLTGSRSEAVQEFLN